MILRLPAQKIAVKTIFGGLYEQNGTYRLIFICPWGAPLKAAFV